MIRGEPKLSERISGSTIFFAGFGYGGSTDSV
jgi:hypothetical protein